MLGSAQRLGMQELIDATPSRNRDLVTAMLVAQVIAPGSKLATARGLRAETAQLTGAAARRHRCDEDDLYAVMDWVLAREEPSNTPWPHGIWSTARWCSMTCPRRRSRAAAARWGRSGTPKTA